MNLPAFTAQASLYRTSRHYVSLASVVYGSALTQSVVTAQSGERFAGCDACEISCSKGNVRCQAVASAAYTGAMIGCVATGPFAPVCEAIAAGAYAGAIGGCYAWFAECMAEECWLPGGDCCPVFCELGHCCSEGETCIPHGCCPNDRTVCGGTCCAVGETCCGDTCCPSNYYCLDGNFCSEYPSNIPFGNPPPPPPPVNNCVFGGAPCGSKCCAPGLQCCGVFQGQPDCRTSCIR
jgi:hypothetical protein